MSDDEQRPETSERVEVALAIPIRQGKLLVSRRAEGSHLAGHWEFPGGKIESGEDPAAAAQRELKEETGLNAGELEPLVLLVHDYADRPLRFHVFVTRDAKGQVSDDGTQRWVWKSLSEIEELKMPEANRRVLRALRWRG
jgi:8-oxo-dGTP diphosphatase